MNWLNKKIKAWAKKKYNLIDAHPLGEKHIIERHYPTLKLKVDKIYEKKLWVNHRDSIKSDMILGLSDIIMREKLVKIEVLGEQSSAILTQGKGNFIKLGMEVWLVDRREPLNKI